MRIGAKSAIYDCLVIIVRLFKIRFCINAETHYRRRTDKNHDFATDRADVLTLSDDVSLVADVRVN